MRTVTLSRAGHAVGATSDREIMRALAQSIVKINATGPIAGLADNSGGLASGFVPLPAPFLDSPGGANLAAFGAVNTNVGTVANALKTLYGKANALAVAIGLAPTTYAGGGTDGAGTIGAISTAVAAAATGASAANSQALADAINSGFMGVGNLANRIVEATGDNPLKLNPGNVIYSNLGVVAGFPPLADGAANVPGVAAADWVAAFTLWQNAAASIAAALNAARTPGTVRVIAIR